MWSVWGGSWQEEWSSGGSQPQPWLPGRAGLLEAQVLPAGRIPWARGRGACRGSWVCQLVKPPAGWRRGWSSCGHVSLGAALDVPVQGDSSQSTGHHSNHPGNRCHQAGLSYPKELHSEQVNCECICNVVGSVYIGVFSLHSLIYSDQSEVSNEI